MNATIANRRAASSVVSPIQEAVKTGLIGGIIAALVSLIGMVDVFNDRFIIGDVITTGQTLLAVITIGSGYIAAGRAARLGLPPAQQLLQSAIAGFLVATVLAALLFLGTAFNLRSVLVNAAPALWEILTFDQEMATGVPLLFLAGLVMGLLGGILHLMPANIRNAIEIGLAVMIFTGLLRDLVRLIINRPGAGAEFSRFLFAGRGLTVPGALFAFIVPFALRLAWLSYTDTVRTRVEAMPAASRRTLRWVAIALGSLFLLTFPQIFGRFPTEVMNNVGLLGILMGLGLNIVVGFAGLLDLGYVGFFAIGAYTMAVLTSPELGFASLTFWQALPIAMMVTVFFGVLLGIPVLKMRGDYLAIVTLGFGEIIRLLVLSDALRAQLGGAQGITRIPNAQVLNTTLNSPETLYYLILAAVLLAWFISRRLRDSRLGRAWMAIREDEDVAEAMGIDLVATKLMAFGTGAAMAGLGGAIFASKLQSIVPQSFDLLISVNALAVIIIGGLASIPGVAVGALLLIGLPELLREFSEYRLWVYGVLLMVMMIYRPEGFWPEETRRRELHEVDEHEIPVVETEEPAPGIQT